MNEFKNAYQSAIQDINILGMEEIQIDISDCMNEGRHRRRVMKQVQRATATAFSTVCVIFLCGFGTAAAAEYIQNVIKVNEMGFESADTATMASDAEETNIRLNNKAAVQVPVYSYYSWEEFEENEDIIFSQPSISMGAEIDAVKITVCGNWAMARYDIDERVLWIERTDYADTNGHVSSKVFPGGVSNERNYTTPQGYIYTLIDSVRESTEEPLQIHGAVTVGNYEAYIDFMGFTEEEAERIIDSIDLSVYE